MKKAFRFILLGATILLLGGCATATIRSKIVWVGLEKDRKPVTYVLTFTRDPWGQSLSTCDRYDKDGKLIAHDCSSGSGPLDSALGGLEQGALNAGALTGFLHVLP